jgi:hypothetical protein
MFFLFPQEERMVLAPAFGVAALPSESSPEERSQAGAFEQNSALALFCAGLVSTAGLARSARRLRQRRYAKRWRAATPN